MPLKLICIFVVLALAGCVAHAGNPICVSVKTKAPHNQQARVWCHVPAKYDAKRRTPYPVLVYFGGRNCSGEAEASGKLGWSDWADEHGVFLVAPGFQDDAYWEPAEWSGQALLDALSEIKRTYRIDDSALLYYGYSAGSQASNLFPAWRPKRCRAWVSHACGVFHEPRAAMRDVPGLITCGDVDAARYVISRDFVAKARRRGVEVIWKSFPNHPHDVPPDSLRLARAFLEHHLSVPKGKVLKPAFVGDDADAVYYPSDSAEAENIDPSDLVRLPSRAVAAAWGEPAVRGPSAAPPDERVHLRVRGIEFVCRIPRQYDHRSRIIVLFGGRGWSGGKTLDEFGFGRLADRERAFLVSPSFSRGEYWNPSTGTGAVLASAVAELEKRYGLRRQPLVLYGYSAGGQCSALFAQAKELSVAAWGVHGCGVFPEAPARTIPALITCGERDADRMRIGRNFSCRYREGGGALLLKPLAGGHELSPSALALAREWIRAVLAGGESWIWGEDGTYKIAEKDAIEAEFRNPLYTTRLSDLWRE